MESKLQNELSELNTSLMKMFSLTEKALDNTLQALVNRDDDLAQAVLDGDEHIDQLEVNIEDQILNILALWQPVARDLRFLTACSRVARELERIGDQSTTVAERIIMLNRKPRLSFMNNVQALFEVAADMYRKVIQAFVHQDDQLALEVCKMDNQADELNIRIMESLIKYMASESVIVERAVHTIIIANNLERVGDLATNIAEEVVFIVRGVNLKHCSQLNPCC